MIGADQPDFRTSVVFYFPRQSGLEDGVYTGLFDCFPMHAVIGGEAGLEIIMCVSLHDKPDDNRATKSCRAEETLRHSRCLLVWIKGNPEHIGNREFAINHADPLFKRLAR